jgi:uncharacterized membrane protein YheB (UPF0754 family)
MQITYILAPLIGALIGWITNLLAIRFIFWPHDGIKIIGTGLVFQGVIPKRKAEIAASLGKLVETEFLSLSDLLPQFEGGVNNKEFINEIVTVISSKLIERLPAFIPHKLCKTLEKMIKDILYKELPNVLPEVVGQGLTNLSKNVSIANIVESKINQLELKEFEKMVVDVTKRELRFIEYFGAALGFFIGLVQVLIIYLTTGR